MVTKKKERKCLFDPSHRSRTDRKLLSWVEKKNPECQLHSNWVCLLQPWSLVSSKLFQITSLKYLIFLSDEPKFDLNIPRLNADHHHTDAQRCSIEVMHYEVRLQWFEKGFMSCGALLSPLFNLPCRSKVKLNPGLENHYIPNKNM